MCRFHHWRAGSSAEAAYELAYETYMARFERSQIQRQILICHALNASASCVDIYAGQGRQRGWWDSMISPGKSVDTNQLFCLIRGEQSGALLFCINQSAFQ
jgi:homoserine O-acetyltransferase